MLKITKITFATARNFNASSILNVDQFWRRKMKFPINPNTESPLTYLPDFTYMDGRSTPLGRNQKRRLFKQRELSAKIVDGISEVDFAVERFKQLTVKSELEKRKILDSILKMKGFKLLKS